MKDLLKWCFRRHVPEVLEHCVVWFEEVILQPLRDVVVSSRGNSREKRITPYREANVFCMIFSSSITRASNTKKRSTGCHQAIWSGMERRSKNVGWAYVIGCRWRVEHEFSIEDCVPHWKRLVGVMREEEPRLEVVLVLTVYLRMDTEFI